MSRQEFEFQKYVTTSYDPVKVGSIDGLYRKKYLTLLLIII